MAIDTDPDPDDGLLLLASPVANRLVPKWELEPSAIAGLLFLGFSEGDKKTGCGIAPFQA